MTIQNLLDKADIVKYIQQYVALEFKEGEYWGLSPFKSERTPSFSVNESGVFYDFSTSKSGNILNFIQDYHKCDFRKAVKILKEFLNISEDVWETPRIITEIKHYKEKTKAKEDILRQEIDQSFINRCRKAQIKEWVAEGISQEVMDIFNVRYNLDGQSIIFEVRDNDGKLVSLKSRTINPIWKELGLRKYTYTNSITSNDFFWGFYHNKDACVSSGEIVLVEGEKSVMKLMTWGINNCAAVCTSHLNDYQLKALIELGIDVVVAFDKNVHKEIRRNDMLLKLKRFCRVYTVIDKDNLLGEKDAPVDKGLDVWKRLYDRKRIL